MIARLAGYISEPYRQDEVLEAARALQPPFLCREIATATGLPLEVVNRVLTRLVQKGILTRSKAAMTVSGGVVGRLPGGAVRRGSYIKRCYLYSWAEAE